MALNVVGIQNFRLLIAAAHLVEVAEGDGRVRGGEGEELNREAGRKRHSRGGSYLKLSYRGREVDCEGYRRARRLLRARAVLGDVQRQLVGRGEVREVVPQLYLRLVVVEVHYSLRHSVLDQARRVDHRVWVDVRHGDGQHDVVVEVYGSSRAERRLVEANLRYTAVRYANSRHRSAVPRVLSGREHKNQSMAGL